MVSYLVPKTEFECLMRMKTQRFTANCPKPEPTANVQPVKETNDKHN